MKILLSLLTVGYLVTSSAFAQGTAGNTPNTGPEGSGNFVAGKPEAEGTSVTGSKGREQDASYGKPEGEGTSYVGGRPAK